MTTPTATRPATWTTRLWDEAIINGRGPLFLRRSDGWMLPLPVERWCAAPDAADAGLLRRCRGSVVDIGCGPGRFVAALHHAGHRVLGVDVSAAAAARTAALGGEVVCGSIFNGIPGEGGWDTALLADGNIGIGGDPSALLGRTTDILAPRGQVLTELAYDDVDESVTVHVDDGRGNAGPGFAWARVGASALARHAHRAGLRVAESWEYATDRRRFARLQRA